MEKTGIEVFVPLSNSGFRSYDGVKVGALRIVEELEDFLEKNSSDSVVYNKISFVGYSLGGLWCRYAIGELNKRKMLKTPQNKNGQLEPIIFTTFATPHAGTLFQKKSFRSSLFNFLGRSILGQSGKDLFLDTDSSSQDTRPLLEQMADPNGVFFEGLAAFKYRYLYANSINDRTVPFYTSYLTLKDPFRNKSRINIVHKPHPELNSDTGSENDFYLDTNGLQLPFAEVDPYMTSLSDKDIPVKATAEQYQMLAFLTLLGPFFFPIVLIVSSLSSIVSYNRVRNFLRGKQGTKHLLDGESFSDSERKPLKRRRESISEGVADIAGEAVDDLIGSYEQDPSRSVTPSPTQQGKHILESPDLKELEMTSLVKTIVKNLNELSWDKRIVQVRRIHSHAEIVDRRGKGGQGKELIKSWALNLDAKLNKLSRL